MVGYGKYGVVFKGRLRGQPEKQVAIKKIEVQDARARAYGWWGRVWDGRSTAAKRQNERLGVKADLGRGE